MIRQLWRKILICRYMPFRQRVIIRNYEGKVFEYPELNDAGAPLRLGQGGPPSVHETGVESALKGCHTTQEGHGQHRQTLD